MYDVYSETHSQDTPVRAGESTNVFWSESSKTGRFSLSDSLSPHELKCVLELYKAQKEVSVLQHPEWDNVVKINGETRYFTYFKGDELLAYAIIRFPNRRKARLRFGPVAVSPQAALEAMRRIVNAVRETSNAWYFYVQLPWQTGESASFVETNLNDEFEIKTFNDRRNWASSIIDTSVSNEELAQGFSKNHKRSLKKAAKLRLSSRICKTEEEIRAFSDIYIRMYAARGKKINAGSNLAEYLRLLDFFERTDNGFFYGVFQEDKMIGGMIIIRQGDYGFYHHSASDPECRNIPIQHTGVLSVLDVLRERGIRYFDFGGYNHMVGKNDQVYNINRFKDGFTKDYIYYPRLMYFEFVPNAVEWMTRYQNLKNLVKKIIRR